MALEVRQTVLLVVGAVVLGLFAQLWVPPGPWAMTAVATVGGLLLIAAAFVVPGRLRNTLGGFRFTAVLLTALGLAAALGTLILQRKPPEFYVERYGAVGSLINVLRLDDIFHSLWFGGLVALLVAGTAVASLVRFPVTWRNAGFHLTHLGILLSLFGAGLSATLAVRGRIDLREGMEATTVRTTKGNTFTGDEVPLGFGLRLDDFGLDRYEAEYRVTFYEPQGESFRLRASFDPVVGEKRRLSGGASYVVKGYYPDFTMKQKPVPSPDGSEPRLVPVYATASQEPNNPAVHVLFTDGDGRTEETLLLAHGPGAVRTRNGAALTFERRSDEVKTYRSHVTVAGQGALEKREITVNNPLSFNGWMIYQANYNPQDLTYSGFDLMKDPGVSWVFTGFGLIGVGVFYIFYIQPRLRRRRGEA